MNLKNNEIIETPSKLKKVNWFNRPTTLSKILAMILFIVFPFVAFYLGFNYQKMIIENNCLIQKEEDALKITPSPIPTITQKKETAIMDDWKSFTGKDSDFGVQTTISLPPDCDFVFSDSEWDLNCGENEKWDYTNSVYRGNDEQNPKNHYSGESLQQWYQQYINQDKIISAKEYPINKGHYLELQIKLANSDKMETNYVYIQNNIVHILRPLVIDEPNSVVKKNISIIFTSLKSNITK